MSLLTVVSIVLALLGALMCILGIRRLFAGRRFSALKFEVSGGLMLLCAAFMFFLGSNLYLYGRLVYEDPVAEIEFHQLGPEHFTAILERGELRQKFDMRGDEWQMDAQVLLWRGLGSAIGLDPQYRLSRLSGRYTKVTDEQEKPLSVYALDKNAKVDLWGLASKHPGWFSWLVDAAYGSAVYLPMSDNAIYQVSITRSGLVARPMNDPAKQAVSHWVGL